MKNIKFNTYKKINKLNNYFTEQFNKISNFRRSKFVKISNFNKLLILLISFLFLYLFYLSIPTLYNKGDLQKNFTSKLLEEFRLNISFSPEITYSILPSPHFIIENVKIFNNDNDSPKELSQIKKLKIFIHQTNFIHQNKLKIKKIVLEEANFSISKIDLDFFKNFFKNKFSEKKLFILNSKIFYKNIKNETISILGISKLSLLYNQRKLINEIVSKGKVYNIPYNLKWTKDFKNKKESIMNLKINDLNLEMKNINSDFNQNDLLYNVIKIGNTKLETEYKILQNKLEFKSDSSKIYNGNLSYEGEIFLNPFDLKLFLDIEKLDLKKSLITLNLFRQLLKSNLLFNQNLNANIKIDLNEISNNKLVDSLNLFLNLHNGNINSDNSYLSSNKIGNLILTNSSLENITNELIFRGSFNLVVNNQDKFYRTFQISKKNRKKLTNIFFDLDFNFFNNELKILDFRINDLNDEINEEVLRTIENLNLHKDNEIKNWIDLKNFVNKIFISYSG